LDSIKAFFNKAVDWEYINKSPAKPIKPLKKPLNAPRFLDDTEVRLLLENAAEPLKTAFLIAFTYRVSY
jgi:site-specific recombinase XerD